MHKDENDGLIFTMYEDLQPFNTFLFSMWKVCRTKPYVTHASRPNEPQFLNAFIRTTDGEGKILSREGTIILPKNSLVLLDVNKIVNYSPVAEKWEYIWYNFSPKNNIPFFQFNKVYNLSFSATEEEINAEMEELMSSYTEINIKLTTLLFIELVYRWVKNVLEIENNTSPHYKNISDVAAYINTHIREDFSVKDLAQKCYLSERQFRCVFTKIMGLPPKAYVCRQKLKKAAIMLKTSTLSVSAIAYELNYSSPYQFSKEFKAHYSLSPKQYRDKIKN